MDRELKKSDFDLKKSFKSLKDRQDIARMLEVNTNILDYYLDFGAANYKCFNFNKKNGKVRIICAPNSSVKILQKKLLYILELNAEIRRIDPVHGFKKDRSILTNAKTHFGCKETLNFDLKDFFPSINFGRVRGLFMSDYFGFNNTVATSLAKLCCYKNELPQGAPTSPFLSNMVAFQLDNLMMNFSRKNKVIYTRYADDITLSSKNETLSGHCFFSGDTWILSNEIQSIVQASGFEINQQKSRYRNNGGSISERLEVTNIVINEKLNVSWKYIKQIRAILNNWEKHGYKNAEIILTKKYKEVGKMHDARNSINLKRVVAGKLNFIKFVRGENDAVYRKYANQFLDLTKSKKDRYDFDIEEQFEKNTLIIQTGDGLKSHSTGFYISGVGIITASHVIKNTENIKYSLPENADFKDAVVVYQNEDKDFAILWPKKYQTDLMYSNLVEEKSLLKTPYIITKEIARKGAKFKACGYSNYITASGMTAKIAECTLTNLRPSGNSKTFLVQENMHKGDSGGPVFEFSTGHIAGMSIRGGFDPGGGAGEILPTSEIKKEIKAYRREVLIGLIDVCNKIKLYKK